MEYLIHEENKQQFIYGNINKSKSLPPRVAKIASV